MKRDRGHGDTTRERIERSGQPDWLTGGARYRRAKREDFYIRHADGSFEVVFYHGRFHTVEATDLKTEADAEKSIESLLRTGDYKVRVN